MSNINKLWTFTSILSGLLPFVTTIGIFVMRGALTLSEFVSDIAILQPKKNASKVKASMVS
ncbi:MAG: hypothetical protein DID89_2727546067 [Candidatus Nitrotoga sp. CP45]|nr:MAG: hypothetical protein DID89_2727546067 [Candidatus Nitrotoga sp. CP45]